eukprot:461756_1
MSRRNSRKKSYKQDDISGDAYSWLDIPYFIVRITKTLPKQDIVPPQVRQILLCSAGFAAQSGKTQSAKSNRFKEYTAGRYKKSQRNKSLLLDPQKLVYHVDIYGNYIRIKNIHKG